ncbi:hypothetical protein CDEST_11877 [Colletotrichum destructivum]|uniref:Uncharacterized protein n=1 Tax=Colletotrichum destructivum TaxID=34406 RepID=A0AAX4IUE4_9PEZI|nr:hypothetical protein CDEST_11877 [Colletotrichum destructivum]
MIDAHVVFLKLFLIQFDLFDKQCEWVFRKNEPNNSQGKASLRSLYAYFIDKELADIGATAAKFAKDPKKEFENMWNKMSSAEREGRDDAFEKTKGNDGWCSAKKLKFPRPSVPQGALVYGAYGWKGVRLDAANKNSSIGVPTKITW